jgi:putative tryptophan/tyrosine transport system substrate-binding protein
MRPGRGGHAVILRRPRGHAKHRDRRLLCLTRDQRLLHHRRMDRRVFLLTSLAAPLAGPLAAGAQPASAIRRVGILGNVPLTDPGSARLWGAFGQALYDLGYVEGQSVAIEYVSSDGRYERLPGLASELVRHKAEVIVAPAAQNVVEARRASQTIPIVMVSVGDPVGSGLVTSLARPGGNVTGTTFLTSEMIGKQLELLTQIVPRVARLAVLSNPANPGHRLMLKEATTAAQSLGAQLQPVEARGPDLGDAFGHMARQRAGAVFVPWDGTYLVHMSRIVQLAATHRLPALYGQRGFVDAGGLAAYGPSAIESFRRAAVYVDKILKGARPADLPIEQPTKFELVINLKTTKALGLTIPPSLLARADQVIDP